MKEIADAIKNVMSNKAWRTVDATLAGLRLSLQGPHELRHAKGGPTPKNKIVGQIWTQSRAGETTQIIMQLLQICTAISKSRALLCMAYTGEHVAQGRIGYFLKQRQHHPRLIPGYHIRRH